MSAALSFQTSHSGIISTIEDDLKPEIRVGIAMGEVIIANNTATGAGIVLAQRIEQLADSGGLCITGAIHEALSKRLPFDLEDIGEQCLKGFDYPVRVYRVSLRRGASIPYPDQNNRFTRTIRSPRIVVAASILTLAVSVAVAYWFDPWQIREKPASPGRMAFSLTDKPSVAVLPFLNLSDDPSQIYFSDGISEDIITDLSQLSKLNVISRNSSFTYRNTSTKVQDIGKELGVKYLLEGSVRKAGTQIRITAQLIDTNNGHQLWAERYDRELIDVFAVQDEITERIVSILSIQLTGDEQRQLTNSATKSFEAYDLFLQGQISSARRTKEGRIEAAEFFRQAISVDADFARAYGARYCN